LIVRFVDIGRSVDHHFTFIMAKYDNQFGNPGPDLEHAQRLSGLNKLMDLHPPPFFPLNKQQIQYLYRRILLSQFC
jgi:hypothetical protein